VYTSAIYHVQGPDDKQTSGLAMTSCPAWHRLFGKDGLMIDFSVPCHQDPVYSSIVIICSIPTSVSVTTSEHPDCINSKRKQYAQIRSKWEALGWISDPLALFEFNSRIESVCPLLSRSFSYTLLSIAPRQGIFSRNIRKRHAFSDKSLWRPSHVSENAIIDTTPPKVPQP
jgi:hypothetical protein